MSTRLRSWRASSVSLVIQRCAMPMGTTRSLVATNKQIHLYGKVKSMTTTAKEFHFTCENCGGDGLEVSREYIEVAQLESLLPCRCGSADYAAQHTWATYNRCQQSGLLDEDHRFQLDTPEVVEDLGKDNDEYEVLCPECEADGDEYCWQHEPPEFQDHEDEAFFVRCLGCRREIEFGWSHPDRGGRIWPAECNDFNPWKCWPEPRYEESWHSKGWLLPISVEEVAKSLDVSLEFVQGLVERGELAKHPKCKKLASDSYALRQYQSPQEEGRSMIENSKIVVSTSRTVHGFPFQPAPLLSIN